MLESFLTPRCLLTEPSRLLDIDIYQAIEHQTTLLDCFGYRWSDMKEQLHDITVQLDVELGTTHTMYVDIDDLLRHLGSITHGRGDQRPDR